MEGPCEGARLRVTESFGNIVDLQGCERKKLGRQLKSCITDEVAEGCVLPQQSSRQRPSVNSEISRHVVKRRITAQIARQEYSAY